MVLVILPALEGLRPAWREAAENMGARTWHYWRFVGGPVLLPSFLGCVLLLFGSAFSAYATAEALTNGTIPLTPIQIGSFLNGNVIAGQENIGKALGLGMVVIIAVAMIIYVVAAAEGRQMAAVAARDRSAAQRAAAGPRGERPARPAVWRWVVLISPAVYFLLPLYGGAPVRRDQGLRLGAQPGRLRLRHWPVAPAGAWSPP